jgi:hypothetical protein
MIFECVVCCSFLNYKARKPSKGIFVLGELLSLGGLVCMILTGCRWDVPSILKQDTVLYVPATNCPIPGTQRHVFDRRSGHTNL